MAGQADIVRETGLSRTTASSLIADLLDEGVVVERSDSARQAPSPSGGRPPTLLRLEPSSGGLVGIDFGREIVRVAVSAPVRSDAPGFASGVIFPAWAEIDHGQLLLRRPLPRAGPACGPGADRLISRRALR